MKMSGEAGVDEAGCGSLIGDLVAAAVVLPHDFDTTVLDDSKKLTPARRANAVRALRESSAAIGIGIVTVDEINKHPFGWARRIVFQRALDDLVHSMTPSSIIVDGTQFFHGYRDIPYECHAKADATYSSVSAASIIAKETRDARVLTVCDAHEDWATRYGWRTNKGYPSAKHREALREHGPTVYHRMTFAPCRLATMKSSTLCAF